ncbi:hypothetical protein AAG570_004037 [Ranatra chinensis]|uniref:Uncharacterized protein n=1 Tax=Ranatra chinensis TaxID=642074 RepID=A0ABD0Y2L6_9HEMI
MTAAEECSGADQSLLGGDRSSGGGGGGGDVKVTIVPAAGQPPRSLTHLPKRPPVDIQFSDLCYTVSEAKQGHSIIEGILPLFVVPSLLSLLNTFGLLDAILRYGRLGMNHSAMKSWSCTH